MISDYKKVVLNVFETIFSKYAYAYVFVFYSFIKTFKYFAYQKIPTYFMVAYGLIVFIYKFKDVHNKFGNIGEVLPSILILISACLSMLLSKNWGVENLKVLMIFIISLFVLLPEEKNDNDNNIYEKLYKFCLLVSILFFIYTLISFLHYIVVGNVENRPTGMLNELTYFAQSIVACIGASVYCFIYTKKRSIKVFEIINFLFQSFVLFLTLQRGSLYGYIIAFVLLVFLVVKYSNLCLSRENINISKNIVIIVCAMGLLVLVLLVLSGKFSIKLVLERLTSGLTLREYIYKFGFLAMSYHRNYLFGATRSGIYNSWYQYLQASFEYWKEPYEKYSIVRGCIDEVAIHSTVLEQLFVHGILGLLSLLYMYLKILYKLFIAIFKIELNIEQLALISASFFCLLTAMFDSVFNRTLLFDIVYVQNLCFFVFAGALFRLIRKNK